MPKFPTTHDTEPTHGLLAGAVIDPVLSDEVREQQQHRRRWQRLGAVAIALVAFAFVAALVAQVGRGDTNTTGTAPVVAVNAQAAGVLLLRPGHAPVRIASAHPIAGVTAQAQGVQAQWQLEGVASAQRITSAARVAAGKRSATARVSTGHIELFGGRIQLTNARIDAQSAVRAGTAAGAITIGADALLTVDGAPRAIRVNDRIAMEGVGTVIVNEQAVVANAPTGDAQTGPRYRIVGALLHIRVTHDGVAGLPVGSELVIGRVDAGVREGVVRKVAPDAPDSVIPSTTHTLQMGEPKPGEATLPRHSTSVRGAAAGTPSAGFSGYLFPVLGHASFGNDWGAPRASTGVPHPGTDIFADQGTPVVAVADGVLDRVGWNTIGGYRFWLFDEYGNSFYHAHLSAYSPIAYDGAHVKRGDVIGFVGHTGDAQYTPPHLHFEIHPGNGDPTNPFPFLTAWRHGIAAAVGLLASGPERTAPLALLNVSDISANSGLEGDVVSHVRDTRSRPIEQENAPRPTNESLTGAIEGPATSSLR